MLVERCDYDERSEKAKQEVYLHKTPPATIALLGQLIIFFGTISVSRKRSLACAVGLAIHRSPEKSGAQPARYEATQRTAREHLSVQTNRG